MPSVFFLKVAILILKKSALIHYLSKHQKDGLLILNLLLKKNKPSFL